MKSNVARVGSTGAIVVSVAYMTVGLNFFLRPTLGTPAEVMELLGTRPIYHYVDTLGYALAAIMMIPVITAMTDLLEHVNAGLIRWAAIIGYVGCGGTIMSSLRMLRLVPVRAQAFLEGDEMVRTAIQYNWIGNSLDPDGWLLFGTMGFWTLVVAFAVLRKGGLFPRAYGYLGLAAGALLILAPVGGVVLPGFDPVLAVAGGLALGPIWAGWTGVLLRRHAAAVEPSRTSPAGETAL